MSRANGPIVRLALFGRLGCDSTARAERCRRRLAEAGRGAGLNRAHEISLLVCDGPTMRKLNARWRRIDRPTNVLAFPLHQGARPFRPAPGPVGDIAVALPIARREARERGIALDSHLDRLLVHGLLHLIGFDHATDAQAAAMERRERRLLANIGER